MGIATILCVYNRPKHTAQVIDALREHQVHDLFVFCDGAKNEQDAEKVRQVHTEIAKIDWGVPTVRLNTGPNKGLATSIVAAMDYTLQFHDVAILLEDDIVPGKFFFEFMYACINRYKNNPNVLGISGYTIPIPQAIRDDYEWDLYFHPRIGSWGWATWRHAWEHYERDIASAYHRALAAGVDLNQGGQDVPHMVRQRIAGTLDAWTGGWLLAGYTRQAYYVYPTTSHVRNIGMDGSGVHCGVTERYDTPLALTRPDRYPPDVVLNQSILEHFRTYYR